MRGKVLAFLAPVVLLVSIAAMQSNVWHVVNGVLTGPGFVTSGPILNSSGTLAAPSYSFAASPTSGMFFDGAAVGITLNGANRVQIGSFITVRSDGGFQWSSTTDPTAAADVSLARGAANRLDLATGDSFNLVGGGGAFLIAAVPVISSTAPTIASGFGTSPSVVASNGTAAFTVNVGTGGTATAGVLTMPAATTGWNCSVENRTGGLGNVANQRTMQIATTTTSVTVENQTISTGAVLAWTASDVLALMCLAY